jgi:hypothetical protein
MKTLVSVFLALLCGPAFAAETTVWHFFDLWNFHRTDNVELCQGQPVWLRDKTYVDPFRENVADHLNSWPTVWRDNATGKWRMIYSAKWRPATLMAAESDDGLAWRPLACPDIAPEGGKLAPHHVFTLPDSSVGGAYLDPQATDGFPFKMFAHQMGAAVHERAKRDPTYPLHATALHSKPNNTFIDELTLVSKDGLHWEMRLDLAWGRRDWHPEPPLFGFWRAGDQRHVMTVRPGWGDRRVCIQNTADFRRWSGPQPLLQPDPLDGLVEFYGMPVFRYGDAYVGLLWVFHCETSEPPAGFNRSIGALDVQLTYSYDGEHFQRGFRRPLIGLNAPGEPGGGAIETACLVETPTELRFYSEGSAAQHGRGPKRGQPNRVPGGILIHTLRKDGLTYLRSQGGWASFTSKPLALLAPRLAVNILAPQGEARFQLTDIKGVPLPGFSFDDCEPVENTDALEQDLRWKNKSLADVLNQPVRLEAKFRNAQIHAVRGRFQFLDAFEMNRLTLEGHAPSWPPSANGRDGARPSTPR